MTKEAESVIDAAEWVRAIRDGKFKPTVDQVRSYIKLDDKDKARNWKMKLAAAVWAGECRKGRNYKHTTNRTGYAIFDFDNLRDDQLRAARQLLEVFPWIVAVHVTASGRGLRVVANIGIVHIDVYRQAYEQVAECLHEITGLELDMACKDFARASLASYDPEIYYNPKATVFPYGEEHNPLNYVPATGPDPSEDFRYLSNPVAQALAQGCQSEASNGNPSSQVNPAVQGNPSSQGYSGSAPDVDDCINRFFYNNTYVQGSRTRTMLKLGLYLRWRGVQSWQLDHAIHVACARGVQPGITPKEIERAIRWGYEHGEEGGKMPEKQGHGVQKVHINPYFDEKTAQSPYIQDDTKTDTDEDENIDTYCNTIPDEVFETLPSDIKELLKIAKDNKERDTLFLSILAISSGLFPALRTDYGKHAAEIRMFFHHERVGQSYKTDKDPIVIDFPKLALMLSGTPEQLVNFIKTLEDGMYSRFMFYTMSPTYKWKNQSPLDGNGNINARELFASVGEKMKANFFKTKDKEIMINFTREQWDKHTEIFQRELGYVAAEENPNVMAIVFRSGLITMRVAMALCGYRIMEAGWDVNEYTCSDEDFDSAMKIVLTCMTHSINLSTIIGETIKRQRLTNYYKLLPALKAMKKEFRYTDFLNEVRKLGFGDSAAKRALKKYLKSGLISRTSDGYRKNKI